MPDILGGSEPYSMDFGDREYGAWLTANLSEREQIDRCLAFDRYCLTARWHPLRRRRRRAFQRFDQLAEQRGGPAPGPAWKVRHEFGEVRGE